MSTRFSNLFLVRPGMSAALFAALGVMAGCSATHDAAETNGTGTGNAALVVPPLPSPAALARRIDTECYRSDGAPPVAELGVRQLNPVLKGKLPNQRVKLHEMTHTCLPVAKNGNIPPDEVLPYVSMVDLACYRAEADPVDVGVTLSHLNPVLQDLPDEEVRLRRLSHFCTPVRKNFAQIAPAVRRFVQSIDLACYELEQPTSLANRPLWLSHLNPVVRAFNFPNRLATLERARHLCVPVAKNQEVIPDDVLQRVQYIDLLSYQTDRPVTPPAFPLTLQHMNPLFSQVPPTNTTLHDPGPVLVPVAKNHVLPPG